MAHHNGHVLHLMFLLKDETSLWYRDMREQFPAYRLSTVHTPVAAWEVIRKEQPDAIVAEHNADNLQFFDSVKNTSDQKPRPVLALVADASILPNQTDCADLLLPTNPPYLTRLLTSFLELQLKNWELQSEKKTLLTEIEQLKNDLSSQKRSIDEVNLLKNAIVRNVSHELKTPLLQVKSAVALIAEDVRDSKLADYALGATARLEGVVRNITQLADSLEITMGPILIREIIEFAIRNLRRSWERKDDISRIKVKLDDSLPAALGNKHGLGTVMQLLMDNALKFSNKSVEVSARRDDEQITISVRDFGIGIAKDQFEQIFESFYQVDNSSTRRYGGAGVGLAIVRLILERHDVKIAVESKEGEGSSFSFSLPIIDIKSGNWKTRE